jgi:hypothetical protein
MALTKGYQAIVDAGFESKDRLTAHKSSVLDLGL